MAAFIEHCAQRLWGLEPEAGRARDYLLGERRLSANIIHEIGIGYSGRDQDPPDGEPPQNAFLFQDKIVVPIRGEFGEPVGIACRAYVKDQKGWFNTSRDAGFHKELHLFLLDKTRLEIFKRNKAYLFEGYMDGLVVRECGLPNLCVPMGTTVGLRAAGLLKRYCREICVCFDADKNKAGQIAQAKTLLEIHQTGFVVSCINLPLGLDPDVFVRKYGVDGLYESEQRLTALDLQKKAKFVAEEMEKNRRKGRR